MNGIDRDRGKVILSGLPSPISISLQREQLLGDSLHCCFSSFHFCEHAEFPIYVPLFVVGRHRSSVLATLWSNIKQSCIQFGVEGERKDIHSVFSHLKIP